MKSDKKDQELENIFLKYIEESINMPSKDLTFKAKEFLNEQKEVKTLVSNATLVTNNENITLGTKNNRQKYYILSIFIAIILMLTSFFIVKDVRKKQNLMMAFNKLYDSDLNINELT